MIKRRNKRWAGMGEVEKVRGEAETGKDDTEENEGVKERRGVVWSRREVVIG